MAMLLSSLGRKYPLTQKMRTQNHLDEKILNAISCSKIWPANLMYILLDSTLVCILLNLKIPVSHSF